MSLDSIEPDETDREKIERQIEKTADRMRGIQRESFVDEKSLCSSCRWAAITRRRTKNNRVVYCSNFNKTMPEDLIECSSYTTVTALSLRQMAELAILIDTESPRKVGFHS